MNRIIAAAVAAGLALGAGTAAFADGIEGAGKPSIVRFGSSSESGITVRTEHGVKVYRGAPAQRASFELASAPAVRAVIEREKLIIEHHYHPKIRRLRTQGFYSGHAGKSRRFTQGFYSGPVDKGRR